MFAREQEQLEEEENGEKLPSWTFMRFCQEVRFLSEMGHCSYNLDHERLTLWQFIAWSVPWDCLQYFVMRSWGISRVLFSWLQLFSYPCLGAFRPLLNWGAGRNYKLFHVSGGHASIEGHHPKAPNWRIWKPPSWKGQFQKDLTPLREKCVLTSGRWSSWVVFSLWALVRRCRA